MQLGSSDGEQGFLTNRINRILAAIVTVILIAFIWVLVAQPTKLYAEDSYFYFQVAWNFARGMGSTFNNIMPTNGYHPLWMLMCAAVFKVFPDKMQALHGIAVLIAALQLLSLLTVRRIVLKVAGDLWPFAFLLLVPFCFASQLGTEGALSGLMLSVLMLVAYKLCLRPSLGLTALFSLVAAIAVLSRLDNIFIESFVWCAVWLAIGDGQRESQRQRRRWMLAMLPVYLVLWGSYIGSNWIYFHTIQPISGLLKSKSVSDHRLGANLPHTALISLTIIVICMVIMAIKKRDLFFRGVEVPFALGVLCHAGYIVFVMSSETKWSWYYTSWILLASVLMARVGSILLEEKRSLAVPISVACMAMLALAWWHVSYQELYLGPDLRPPASLNETVYEKAGIHRVLAYDQPGMLAYFTKIQVVPLDGLVGNLQFQRDLATKGIAAVAAEEHIQGFVGPSLPLDESYVNDFCVKVYMAVQFHCIPTSPGEWDVTGVDAYARVPEVLAGTLPLRDDQIVWSAKNYIAVWKMDPQEFTK